MANLTTRSLTASTVSTDNLNKGSALTISEMDSNFLNLNNDKLEISGTQTFSGDLTITSETSSAVGSLIFKEAADNGTDAITLKAPTSTAAYTITLPATAPTNGYGLTTDGSGNLSWTASAGDITEVIAGAGMTGGAASGSATLNVIAGTGITVNADDVEIDTSVVTTLTGTQTLTNKSIDADNNTITNLEVDNLKSGVLDTDITAVSASDDTLASAKAIKTYVDAQVPDDTDGLSEGSTNLYYTDSRFDTRLGTKTTDNLTEGSTNLYFTNTRADARIGLASINDLSDVDTTGIANDKILKYNSTSGNWEIADDQSTEDDLSNNDTDDLAEGSTNLYYTDARARASISVGTELTAAGDGAISYTSGTGVLQYTPPVLSGLTGDTDDVSEGSTNLYYTDSRFDTRLNAKTTDNLAEGSTNLYYTDARAQAVSINNLSEDTTPELGGTLDILGNDIKSSTANVVISADANDKDIELKIKDTGGTLQQAALLNTENRNQHDSPGSGTEETIYEPVLDVPHGIRIGSNNFKFSDNGATPDPDDNYSTTGLIITNGDRELWPQVDIVTFGGANPLYNRFGNSAHIEFPNAALAFKSARGTETSPTAIATGDRCGGVYFNNHDGTAFGGSAARASGSLEAIALEDASSSNDRAVKITMNVMPAGGTGSTSSRDVVLDAREATVDIGNITDGQYLRVDKANNQLVLNDLETITTGTDEHLTLEPNGTGTVKLGKDLDVNGQNIISVSNGDIVLDPDGSGTSYIKAYRVNSATFADMPQMRRQGTAHTNYSLEVSNDSTSTNLTAGQPGGCFGFTQYSDNYSNPSYGGNAYYVGSINGVVGDEGTFGNAGENNNAIRLYTYQDQNGFGLNNVGEFRYASASIMKETLKFDNTSGVITIEAATTNDDLKLKASGTGNVVADAPFVLKSYTTTERNALTAVTGAMIFNTTDSKAQVYDGTAWQNLH
jgi:hypothetical protein